MYWPKVKNHINPNAIINTTFAFFISHHIMGDSTTSTIRSRINHNGVLIGFAGPDIEIGRFVTQKELKKEIMSTL